MFSGFYSPLKRFYKFILKRLIGSFLKNELDLEQLDVQLGAGVVTLKNLELNVDLLNESTELLPVACSRGVIRELKATIPWRNILKEHCRFEITGLEFTLVPSNEFHRPESSITRSSVLMQSIADLDKKELENGVKLHRQFLEADPDQEQDGPADSKTTPSLDGFDASTDDGVKVVASFLELIISRAELEVKDLCVKIVHRQANQQFNTVLAVSLPWMSYSGMGDEANKTDARRSASYFDPKLEYHKAIRFHGFRVDLHEEDVSATMGESFASVHLHPDVPTTIMHADVDQDCIIQLKAFLGSLEQTSTFGPRLRFDLFLRSLRVLMSPQQLRIWNELISAIGESSAQMAERAGKRNSKGKSLTSPTSNTSARQSLKPQDGSSAARPLDAKDFSLIEDMLQNAPGTESVYSANDDVFYDCEDPTEAEQKEEFAPERPVVDLDTPSVEVWQMRAQCLDCSVFILERDDERAPKEWWLSPPYLNKPKSNDGLVRSEIPGLVTDHLLFGLNNAVLFMTQTSTDSSLEFNVNGLSLQEYCLQRLRPSAEQPDSLLKSRFFQQAPPDTFRSYPVLTFNSQSATEPVLLCRTMTRMHPETSDDSMEPLKTSVSLELLPAVLQLDTRFFDRINAILDSFSPSSTSLSDSSISFDSTPSVPQPTMVRSGSVIPVTKIDIDASGLTLQLNFPLTHVPSERHYDLRGPQRSEQLHIVLSHLTASSTMKQLEPPFVEDSVWNMRFQELSCYLLFPSPSVAIDSPPLMVRKRFLAASGASANAKPVALTKDNASIRILTRALAPPAGSGEFRSFGDDEKSPHPPSSLPDDEFFLNLPSFRVWEPPPSADSKSSGGRAPGAALKPPPPTLQEFEQQSTAKALHVVTVKLPMAALALTQDEYFLLMSLYDLILDPPPAPIIVRTAPASVTPTRVGIDDMKELTPPANSRTPIASGFDSDTDEEDRHQGSDSDEDDAVIAYAAKAAMRKSVILPKPAPEAKHQSITSPNARFAAPDLLPEQDRRHGAVSAGGCQHFMALKISIQHTSITLSERVNPHLPPASPTALPPQTFLLELAGLSLFQIVRFDDKPITYLNITGDDVNLHEFESVIDPSLGVGEQEVDLLRIPSKPLLFKTLDANASQVATLGQSPHQNQVLICNVLIKAKPQENSRETLVVVNLRALTLNYMVESAWITKFSEFFTATPPAPAPPSYELAYPAPPVAPLVQDAIRFFFNAYDCAVDYNPPGINSRAVLSFENIRLSINIVGNSPVLVVNIDLRDGSLYLLNSSSKLQRSQPRLGLMPPQAPQQKLFLPVPFFIPDPSLLHALPARTLVEYLDSACFVRVATLDFAEVFIKTTKLEPSRPGSAGIIVSKPISTSFIEITNGLLSFFTCSDSFFTFISLITHFQESFLATLPPVEQPEVDMSVPLASRSSENKEFGSDDPFGHDTLAPSNPRSNSGQDLGNNILSSIEDDMFGGSNDHMSQSIIFPAPARSRGPVASSPPIPIPKQLGSGSSSPNPAPKAGSRQSSAQHIRIIDDYIEDDDEEYLAARSVGRPRAASASKAAFATIGPGSAPDSVGSPLSGSKSRARKGSVTATVKRGSAVEDEQSAFWYPHDRETNVDGDFADIFPLVSLPRSDSASSAPQIIDNHMTLPDDEEASPDLFQLQEEIKDKDIYYPPPVLELVLKDINVCWRIFGGHDFETTAAVVVQDQLAEASAPQQPAPLSEAPIIRDSFYTPPPFEDSPRMISPSTPTATLGAGIDFENQLIFDHFGEIGVHRYDPEQENKAPASLQVPAPSAAKMQVRPAKSDSAGSKKSGRLTEKVMELMFTGATVRVENYDVVVYGNPMDPKNKDNARLSSRVAIAFRDVEVLDLLDSSPFRKFLCYYRIPNQPGREIHSCMFRMELLSVRPDQYRPLLEESRLRMEFLPLRLNVDQDALEFLITFFSGPATDHPADKVEPYPGSESHEPSLVHSDHPVEEVNSYSPRTEATHSISSAGPHQESKSVGSEPNNAVAYFQVFSTRGLKICIDYTPKRVSYDSLRKGDFLQVVHLFPLEEVEIELKPLKLHGIQGWDRLFIEMGIYWGRDIGKHQAHKYLSGVQPIRSLVNVGSGVADLVLVPVTQYKKNGRIFRGLQRGASSFARSVAMETVGITARVALGAQGLLEAVDSVFSTPGTRPVATGNSAAARAAPTTSSAARSIIARNRARGMRGPVPPPRPNNQSSLHKLSNQPRDHREGLQQAYESLARGFQAALHNVVVVPREEYQRGGTSASVKSVLRAVPGAVLQPMIGATEALSKALLGVQNTVEPRKKLDSDDRYKTAT